MKKKIQMPVITTCMAAACLIGGITAAFHGFTAAAVAAEDQKVQVVPTSYSMDGLISLASSSKPEQPKANYTVGDNPLEYYQDKKPTAADISRDEAAAIGAKALQDVFQIDLNGKKLVMGYNPADGDYRAYWSGETEDLAYFFDVDALTGEVMGVQLSRTLSGNVQAGFDISLEQNSQEYDALVQSTAEKLNAVGGKVREIVYKGQGSAGNDPTISFLATGENGQRAFLTFSRYDKAFLGVNFERGVQQMEASERAAEDFAKRAEEYFAANPGATTYEE